MLDKQAVLEYQQIYEQEHGKKISYEDALEKATKFLRLFKMVYQPISIEWLKEKTHKKKK